MKSKYWAIVLCAVVLVVGMVACSQQANQEPQEPAQTAQQSKPVNVEPTAPPVETEPQEEPKQPEVTAPIEVKESDPVDEVVETVPAESTPEPTLVSTEAPKQEPTTTPPVSVPVQNTPPAQQGNGGEQLPADGGDSSGELTPEQQKQSITDILSRYDPNYTSDHIKPGDPGWDDYVKGIAGALNP